MKVSPSRFDGLAGHPACRDYVARATARPSFVKAHADDGTFCCGRLSNTSAKGRPSRNHPSLDSTINLRRPLGHANQKTKG
jgi:hypothetical protein